MRELLVSLGRIFLTLSVCCSVAAIGLTIPVHGNALLVEFLEMKRVVSFQAKERFPSCHCQSKTLDGLIVKKVFMIPAFRNCRNWKSVWHDFYISIACRHLC